MLSAMDKRPKTIREEMEDATAALEAALESAGRGEPGAMDRVKLLQHIWDDVHKRFQEDPDA